jgi:hypothetical protein
MAICRPLMILLIPVALAACASNSSPPSAPTTHTARVIRSNDAALWTQRIRSLLPPGWSVTTDGDSILVARDQPVTWSPDVPNGPGFASDADATAYAQAHASPGPYVLKFTFEPFIPFDEYARLRAVNVAAEKRKDTLQSQIRDLPHMGDSYIADTPEQAARLAAYHQALAQLSFNPLPDFYCSNYSVTLWTPDKYSRVLGPAGDECLLVKSVLINLFTPYP